MLFLFLCGSLLLSCNDSDNEVNENIIDKEVFIDILTDVQILESTHQFIKSKNREFDPDFNYQYLYKEYGVTEEEFILSVNYYSADPKVFEEIYDEVIIRVSEKQVELSERPVK